MTSPRLPLRGIVPPTVTPLDRAHRLDRGSFTRVLEHLLAGGVHGIFVLGSTSEVVFHDADVRREIVEHAVGIVNGRVPVLVGAVDPTTQRVIEHARAAKAAGADGIVVTAPFYARTSQAEIIDHFRFVRDAVDIPLIAYDIPVCVHVKLERATVATLMREGVIAGLKDSSGDEGNFRYALMDGAERPDFFAMTGAELTADCAMLMGAHGIVPGLANVDPHAYVRLYEAAGRGDWAAARAEQEHLCRLFEIVRVGLPRTSVGAAGVGGFKTAMTLLGIIDDNVMALPQRTLEGGEIERVAAILKEVGLLRDAPARAAAR
jgi:4-hydroxy-tetrahydrodipicolinate synthase